MEMDRRVIAEMRVRICELERPMTGRCEQSVARSNQPCERSEEVVANIGTTVTTRGKCTRPCGQDDGAYRLVEQQEVVSQQQEKPEGPIINAEQLQPSHFAIETTESENVGRSDGSENETDQKGNGAARVTGEEHCTRNAGRLAPGSNQHPTGVNQGAHRTGHDTKHYAEALWMTPLRVQRKAEITRVGALKTCATRGSQYKCMRCGEDGHSHQVCTSERDIYGAETGESIGNAGNNGGDGDQIRGEEVQQKRLLVGRLPKSMQIRHTITEVLLILSLVIMHWLLRLMQ